MIFYCFVGRMAVLTCSYCPNLCVSGGLIGPPCRSDGGVDSLIPPEYLVALGAISEHFVVRMTVLIRSMSFLAIGLASGEASSILVRGVFLSLSLLLAQSDFFFY